MHHRPGNVHDLNGAADFMLRCFENAKSQLSGTLLESRIDGAFMARATALFGHGGQMRAERELGWDRGIIRKGTKELRPGISCIDNFSGRGRHPVEKHLPNLLQDIRGIVEPISQADPTFRTTNEYSPITAPEVHRRLLNEKSYTDKELPSVRTIHKKLNDLNFHIQKVQKCVPKKNSKNRG